MTPYHHHHHRHHHFESFFSSYSGTYWSYDACFTPARTDQLCQLVVAEGRTKCNTLSGNGKREVRTILFVVSSFFLLNPLFLLFLYPLSFDQLQIQMSSSSNQKTIYLYIQSLFHKSLRFVVKVKQCPISAVTPLERRVEPT